tara:strand:+ start:427 stop:732 length:306 start_codon:yes stop_codon:yes gene_type:complete
MKIPKRYDIAHIHSMNIAREDIWRGAAVAINHGVLTVALWLDGDEYDQAVTALEAAGWHCDDKTVIKSNWRPTQDGLGYPLTLQKNIKYQSTGRKPKESRQ